MRTLSMELFFFVCIVVCNVIFLTSYEAAVNLQRLPYE
jgi:hypothetical protein